MTHSTTAKDLVREFWDRASCGEELLLASIDAPGYREQMQRRYELEPFIPGFADFDGWAGQKVLEIGVGLGADHQRFAEGGAVLFGIDLTDRAIEHVRTRFALFNLSSDLRVGDAEKLPFESGTFDLVYSWGVIHHSPDTAAAAQEILRVLKPGGAFRVMVYNRYSVVGLMLWLRYALAAGRPFTTLDDIYARYLESPGTKAYTAAGARALFPDANVEVRTVLTHGDLLTSDAGQRHRGALLSVAKAVWPRRMIRWLFPHAGLFMLISGRKA